MPLKSRKDASRVVLGLPLLAACSLQDLQILAKYAYYRDVAPRSRLHRWAYKRHRAALNVLQQGSVPFRESALNVVVALTRYLAKHADAHTRAKTGAAESALDTALQRQQLAARYFADYFESRFYPLVKARALPPLTEGFHNFLIDKGSPVAAEPACRSIDSLWLVERRLVERGLGKENAAELNAMSWDDAQALVLSGMVQRISMLLRRYLNGKTFRDLPEVAAVWQQIACFLLQARVKSMMPDVRCELVGQFVIYAVAHALAQSGWHLEGAPDRLLLRSGTVLLNVGEPIQKLFSQTWAPAQFRDWTEQMHVAAVPL